MAMREHATAQLESFEQQRMQVLTGGAAKERADARRIEAVKFSLAALAVLVYFLGVTFMEAKVTVVGAEINQLQADAAELNRQSDITDLTIGAKSSPERIESYAMTELNMVYPSADSRYYLTTDSSLTIANVLNPVEEPEQLDQPEQGNSFLTEVGQLISGFFRGTALAAQD